MLASGRPGQAPPPPYTTPAPSPKPEGVGKEKRRANTKRTLTASGGGPDQHGEEGMFRQAFDSHIQVRGVGLGCQEAWAVQCGSGKSGRDCLTHTYPTGGSGGGGKDVGCNSGAELKQLQASQMCVGDWDIRIEKVCAVRTLWGVGCDGGGAAHG